MEGFFEWMLESSLLVVLILGIRRIFMGKIRYAAIYALWLIVLLRFIIPVNFIPTPINIGNVFSDAILSGLAADSKRQMFCQKTIYLTVQRNMRQTYIHPMFFQKMRKIMYPAIFL